MTAFKSLYIVLSTLLFFVAVLAQKHHHNHHDHKNHHFNNSHIRGSEDAVHHKSFSVRSKPKLNALHDEADVTETGACPEDTDIVHRLGKSKYYLLQKNGGVLGDNCTQAAERCKKLGLKLAKVDNTADSNLIGRLVDAFMKPRRWSNTYYWMNAKFDQAQESYIWQDNQQPLKFANFFYRPGHPKGYGDFYSRKKKFISDPAKRDAMCLAYALPLPFGKA